MKPAYKQYPVDQVVAALFMAAVLLWLTVSMPFLAAAQQKAAVCAQSEQSSDAPDAGSPFSGSTEEKAPTGFNLSEEFLHSQGLLLSVGVVSPVRPAVHEVDPYTAFHGELLSPPPEA